MQDCSWPFALCHSFLFKVCLSLAHPCSSLPQYYWDISSFSEISLWWPVPLPTCCHFKHLCASSHPCNRALNRVCWKIVFLRSLQHSPCLYGLQKNLAAFWLLFFSHAPCACDKCVSFFWFHTWLSASESEHSSYTAPHTKIKAPVHYHNNNKC